MKHFFIPSSSIKHSDFWILTPDFFLSLSDFPERCRRRIRAGRAQHGRLNAGRQSQATHAGRFCGAHALRRIFDHQYAGGPYAELSRRRQEYIGSRLLVLNLGAGDRGIEG